jgi:hypothetical protein
MRRYQMPQNLQNDFGYEGFTAAERELIFGRNLAGLYGVDVNAARNTIPADLLSSLKTAYIETGAEPSNTQYGWIAV